MNISLMKVVNINIHRCKNQQIYLGCHYQFQSRREKMIEQQDDLYCYTVSTIHSLTLTIVAKTFDKRGSSSAVMLHISSPCIPCLSTSMLLVFLY